MSRPAVEHLLTGTGRWPTAVLELIRAEPGPGPAAGRRHPYLRAEVAYAVVGEDALHVEDVLVRRIRLFIEAADSGTAVAAEVSPIMGKLLGWSWQARGRDPALPGTGRGRAGPDAGSRSLAGPELAGGAAGRPGAGAARGGMSMNGCGTTPADLPA